MDHNALLTQLGYSVNETTTEQMHRILNSTDGLEPKSVVELNDHLKPHLCFVAMSGSEDRLKIKNVATIQEIKERVDEIADAIYLYNEGNYPKACKRFYDYAKDG